MPPRDDAVDHRGSSVDSASLPWLMTRVGVLIGRSAAYGGRW
ncbi:hypothetical protein AB0L33_24585 [Streptomyces sp. NPDC052299]